MKKPTIRKSVKNQLLYQRLVNQYPKAVEAQVRRVRIYGLAGTPKFRHPFY